MTTTTQHSTAHPIRIANNEIIFSSGVGLSHARGVAVMFIPLPTLEKRDVWWPGHCQIDFANGPCSSQ